ncbi:MAG: PAC2 family protein [SAR202 cluster bacterium]|nr:PAC2 family protein [SAR202 cluster bacterium]
MKIGAFEIAEPVPELKNTCAIAMLRPWVDVGRVGTLALNKVERHLGARELGRLARPGVFLDFTRERPRIRIVENRRMLITPNSIVQYAKFDNYNRDFLFLHLREPHMMGEDYCDAIVELLKFFNVTEYCRIGGMYDSVPHTRRLLVTGTLSGEKLRKAGHLVSPRLNAYQGPTSIVNLVTEAMAAANVETTSIMVHIPQYVQLDEDHMGAYRLIQVLAAIYDLPESLADPEMGKRQYDGIELAVDSNPDVKALVQQLEVEFDKVQASRDPERKPALSADMEKFLQEMAERLENKTNNPSEPPEEHGQ